MTGRTSFLRLKPLARMTTISESADSLAKASRVASRADIGRAISRKRGISDRKITTISLASTPLLITSEVSFRIRAVTRIPMNMLKQSKKKDSIS